MPGPQLAYEDPSAEDPLAPIPEDQPEYDKQRAYWATWKGADLVDALKEKTENYFRSARMQGILDRWIIAYAFHHGATPDDLREIATMQVGFTGSELERVRFHINLFRSYNKHAAIMALGEKPAFKAKTINSDQRSFAKAILADKIVTGIYSRYYESHDPEVAEGEGFAGACGTHTRWDFKGGDEVSIDVPVKRPVLDPMTGQPKLDSFGKVMMTPVTNDNGEPVTHPAPTMSGAPVVTTVYPWSLVREVKQSSSEDLWVIIRETENKWNLIEQFGEKFRDLILQQNTQLDQYDFATLFRLQMLDIDNKDMLTVQHFYHARCPAMPNGRYVVVCGDVILWDNVCPVKEGVPYAEMRTSKFIETMFPYADAWDIISIMQALNQCTSDELQNLSLFSRQSTYSEKGSGVTMNGITKGTHWEIPQGSKPPGAVMFAQMPPTDNFKAYLLQQVDRIMGQNGTTRGEPDANVRSGEMAALLDSISIRYQSFRQQAARRFRIRNAQISMDMISRYGETKFFVDVAGAKDRSYVLAFVKEDLSGVQRIDLDVVSPMMQTASGRLQWAKTLLEIPNPQDRAAVYEFVINGDTDAFLYRDRSSRELVRRENELLITGEDDVVPNATDDPNIHIPTHQAAVDRIMASERPDMQAVQRIRMHIMQHEYTYLMEGQPLILQHLGIQPPPPIGPTPDQLMQLQMDPNTPLGNAAWRFQQQLMSGMMPPPMGPLGPSGTPSAETPPNAPSNTGTAGALGGPGASAPGGMPSDPGAPGTSQTPTTNHPTGTPMPQPSQPPQFAAGP